MYTVRSTKKYRTSIKKIGLSGNKKAVQEIEYVVSLLTAGKVLPQKYRDHVLIGDMNGVRECHVQPDLLLLYRIQDKELILYLVDVGSHSKLFGK